ncbi:MAG: NAD-dependent epimerase/dehydratase family protein [Acidobacteriota bacterium]
MSSIFKDRRVLVTGGSGLIGGAFVRALLARGAEVRSIHHHRRPACHDVIESLDGDLRDRHFARWCCEDIDFVVHAAGVSGGSLRATLDPIPMYTDSLAIQTNVIEGARLSGVERLLFVSNSSVYPTLDRPLREEDALTGPPENDLGLVKLTGEAQARMAAARGAFELAIIRTANAYGPGDDFGPDSAHVIGGLIGKAVGSDGPVEVWGDGRAIRDFIHVDDIARSGLFLLEHGPTGDPVNVGTGRKTSIAELARLVLEAAGRPRDELRFTGEAPTTTTEKVLDLSVMAERGFRPGIALEDGLAQTFEWLWAQRLVLA